MVTQAIKNLLGSFSAGGLLARLGWLKTLHQTDDISAIKLCTQQIGKLIEDNSVDVASKAEILRIIANQADPRARLLLENYVRTDNNRPEIAIAVQQACYDYHRQLYTTQLQLIELVFNKPDHYGIDKNKQLSLLINGLLSAMHLLKWRFFHHADAPPNFWLQLHHLHKTARENALNHEPISIDLHASTLKVSDLYLQINMLGNLNLGGLHKAQIEIISQLLDLWLRDTQIDAVFESERHHFFIDEDKNFAARKCSELSNATYLQCWSIKNFEAHLQQALKAYSLGKSPVSYLGDFRPSHHLIQKTLKFLHEEWAPSAVRRQRRKEQRTPTIKSVFVTQSFQNCNRMIKQFNLIKKPTPKSMASQLTDAVSAQVSLQETPEQLTIPNNLDVWRVIDESEHGFGAIAENSAANWIQLNKLVGIYYKDVTTKLFLGVIRSFQQSGTGKLHLGIELIGLQPKTIELQRLGNVQEAIGLAKEQAQVLEEYCAIYSTEAEQTHLVMPRLGYTQNAFYALFVNNERRIIKLGSAIEVEDDWARLKVTM